MNKLEQSVVCKLKEDFGEFKKEFTKFRNNEFFHLKIEVRVALIIACAILGVLLAIR